MVSVAPILIFITGKAEGFFTIKANIKIRRGSCNDQRYIGLVSTGFFNQEFIDLLFLFSGFVEKHFGKQAPATGNQIDCQRNDDLKP